MKLFCTSEHSPNLEKALLIAITNLIRIRDDNKSDGKLLRVGQQAEDALDQMSLWIMMPRTK